MHLSSVELTTVTLSSQVSLKNNQTAAADSDAAARVLTKTKKVDQITPVLGSLHWLPVCQTTDVKILLYVYKALNGLGPKYISDLLLHYEPSRPLRSSGSGLLSVP